MPGGSFYTRLADLRVPRPWWWWLLLGLLLIRDGRRSRRKLVEVGEDLAEVVVKRWEQTDDATATMIDLNQTMVRLTWAVVALTVVVLGATLWLGLR